MRRAVRSDDHSSQLEGGEIFPWYQNTVSVPEARREGMKEISTRGLTPR